MREVLAVPADIEVPAVTPADLPDFLSKENTPRVIDIREPEEFSQGHLRLAESIPMHRFINEKPVSFSDEQDIVFICRNGRRSNQLTWYLQSQGIKNIYHLEGGISALEVASLPKSD